MYFWTLRHTFWWHGMFLDIMTYSLTSRRTSWCHDVLLGVISYFVMSYLPHILTWWRTFWCRYVHFDGMAYFFLTLWRTLLCFDVMTKCQVQGQKKIFLKRRLRFWHRLRSKCMAHTDNSVVRLLVLTLVSVWVSFVHFHVMTFFLTFYILFYVTT